MKIINTNPLLPSHLSKIVEAVKKATGRARNHIHTPNDIVDIARKAQRRLEEAGIPKKDHHHFHVTAVSGEAMPASYKYSRVVTAIRIRWNKSGAMRLTEIEKRTIFSNDPVGWWIMVDDSYRAELKSRLHRKFALGSEG